MTQATPTVRDINNTLIAQFETDLAQRIPLLPRSFLRVLAKVVAGVFVLVYKFAGFTALQQFVSTASILPTAFNGTTIAPLIEWGRLIGVGDPVGATRAELVVTVTGTRAVTLGQGTQLLGRSNGVLYVTTAALDITPGPAPLSILAQSDQQGGDGSGVLGNLPVGAVVAFVNPIAGVETDTTVLRVTTTAADAEDPEVYRRRVIRRFQRRPQGGALVDYQLWGEEVAGILNVYPYTGTPGRVNVYVEATDTPNGIPTQDQLDAVEASINLDQEGRATRRPANAFVTARPITRSSFAIRVLGLVVDNQSATRAQIEADLLAYFLQREPFIVGVSVAPRRDRITVTAVAGVVERVVTANNGVFASVVVTGPSGVVTSYTLAEGEKAARGAVTYV